MVLQFVSKWAITWLVKLLTGEACQLWGQDACVMHRHAGGKKWPTY